MNDNILEKINEDLSLDELGDIAKKALAVVFDKLNKQNYDPYRTCVIQSIGDTADDWSIVFMDKAENGETWTYTYTI